MLKIFFLSSGNKVLKQNYQGIEARLCSDKYGNLTVKIFLLPPPPIFNLLNCIPVREGPHSYRQEQWRDCHGDGSTQQAGRLLWTTQTLKTMNRKVRGNLEKTIDRLVGIGV